ncbi:MAG: hypothetical protein R2769_09970 [Saprospiraceae bacterium]
MLKINQFLPVLILLVSVFSCTSSYQNLKEVSNAQLVSNELPFPFETNEESLKYNLGIQTKSNYFSGIFVLKPVAKDTFRLAMTTKSGQKIFDFSLNGETFEVNHCVPPLQKKLILSSLEEFFKLIVQPKSLGQSFEVYRLKNEGTPVYRYKKDGSWYTIFMNQRGMPSAYHKGNSRKPSVVVDFESYEKGNPDSFKLENKKWVKLEMVFSQLDF